jgi:hypothetical protein
MRLDSNKAAASPFAVRHLLYCGNRAVRYLINVSEYRPLTPRHEAASTPRETHTSIDECS